LAIILRALFMGAFAVVVARVSGPQSETIWSMVLKVIFGEQ